MIDIQPVERDGKYFVEITLDGGKMTPHGPYGDPDEAEAAARHLSAVCVVLGQVARVSGPAAKAQRS